MSRSGAHLTPGQRLGDYVVEAELGRGGMGAVFAVQDTRLRARRALKLQVLGSASREERFAREARALAKVDRHPGVVGVHDHGTLGGPQPLGFTVMDLVEGQTLADELRRSGALPLERATRLAAALADALAHVHAAGITHRDLKPENVLVRAEDDQPLLTDFGLARDDEEERITATGQVMGTLLYMSPEQAGGKKDVGPKSDVFSLGAVLYEMFSGQRAFTGSTPFEVMAQISSVDPPELSSVRPEVPRGLAALVARALAKAPEARPDAAEVAEALGRAARGELLDDPRRGRWVAAVAGAFALAVTVGAVVTRGGEPVEAPAGTPSVAASSAPAEEGPAESPRVRERRAALRAAAQRITEGALTAESLRRLLEPCAARADDPPLAGEDLALARQAVERGLAFCFEQKTLSAGELLPAARALRRVGVRLGREPFLLKRLLPTFGISYAHFSQRALAELCMTYVALDLPLDFAPPLAPVATQTLEPGVVSRYLHLRARALAQPQLAKHPARASLVRFVTEGKGRTLGPLARSHGLAIGAGILDRGAAEQRRLVEQALAWDAESVLVQAVWGLALARAGEAAEAKRALWKVEKHALSNGSPLIFCYRLWGYAALGSEEMYRRTVQDLVGAGLGGMPLGKALLRETKQALAEAARRRR